MKNYKTYTLLHDDFYYDNIKVNEHYQFNTGHEHIKTRKKRSHEKWHGEKNRDYLENLREKFRLLLSRSFKGEKKINILACGCRDINEIDFIKSIDNRINCIGIDLAPSFFNEIFQGNVENFQIERSLKISDIFQNEKVHVVYSSHNLEHLSNPSLHFESIKKHINPDAILFYILPCWKGTHGPHRGHPNYIHCTHKQDTFTHDNFLQYIKEVSKRDIAIYDIDNDLSEDLSAIFKFKKGEE